MNFWIYKGFFSS